MSNIVKENYKLAWKWSKKLGKGIRIIKSIQCEGFANYLKANPAPDGEDMNQWKLGKYTFYKETVYAKSLISNVCFDDYQVDFISAPEGIPDDNNMLEVGFKIWKKDWKLSNNCSVYVKFYPYHLYNGYLYAWTTNSTMIPSEVENNIYKVVFPRLYKNLKLFIDDLRANVMAFAASEADRDFNIKR